MSCWLFSQPSAKCSQGMFLSLYAYTYVLMHMTVQCSKSLLSTLNFLLPVDSLFVLFSPFWLFFILFLFLWKSTYNKTYLTMTSPKNIASATNQIGVEVELKSITAYKEEQGIKFVEGKPLFDFSPVKQGSTQLIKAHRDRTNAYPWTKNTCYLAKLSVHKVSQSQAGPLWT